MSTVKEFDIDKKLGEGGSGVVFQDVWRGIPVAVKRIKLDDIDTNGREEDALDKLDHPNVVKLFHVESDSVFKYFYLELCNASLDQLFLKDDEPKKYRGPMPPAMKVLQQLAGGLEYIHQKKLIHRDIKPENVLIWVDSGQEKVVMKWADFGFSKPVNDRGSHSISGPNKGTNNWYAPEILEIKIQEEQNGNDDTAHQRGTVKSDVFAQGLVFGYYLLNGLHLFGSRVLASANVLSNNPVCLNRILPQSVRDLIQKMVEPDPAVRISSSDVFQLLQRHQQLEMKNE